MVNFSFFFINASANSPTHAFFSTQVEPDHSIKATLNQCLWGLYLFCRLYKQECILNLQLSVNRVTLLVRKISAQCALQQLGLSKSRWEINKNPAILMYIFQCQNLLVQIIDLCLNLICVLGILLLFICSIAFLRTLIDLFKFVNLLLKRFDLLPQLSLFLNFFS